MPDPSPTEQSPTQPPVLPNGGFLGDLTDGRPRGDWKSRYETSALLHITWEKKYLLILLSACLLLPLLGGIFSVELSDKLTNYYNLKRYFFATLGGTLGGTLFSMKWLVHSVAKNTWNYDRQLWRVFTPFLSGGLAFVVVVLINCQMFDVTKPENLTIHKCYGVGFLVGYFSDNAIGKLTEIAQVLFGSSLSKGK